MAARNDPAMGELDYERIGGDFYETPEWVTRALIPHLCSEPTFLTSRDPVWEPACGSGKMSEVLLSRFPWVKPTDLFSRGYGEGGMDFLVQEVAYAPVIVTNPPFSLAEEFIRHAIELTRPLNGTVAMLLRNEYDCALGRNDLFNQPPFCKKVVLTSRPRWFEYEKGDKSPRHNYAWYIFKHGYTQHPTIAYGYRTEKGMAVD